MPRGKQQCPQPGLAEFVPTHGPAMMVADPKKWDHRVRDFVLITPSCPENYWWLRHGIPNVHDSTIYAASMERCLRGLIDMTYELGLCHRRRKACFIGQSMGAYMALE